MVIKRNGATDVLPWEPPPLEPQIETRWLRGSYPWEEEERDYLQQSPCGVSGA